MVDGEEPAPGRAGRDRGAGYTVMAGYLEDDEATAAAVDAEGWLHTGDIGIMDEAGNVTITDRLKDMFIVGGFNAYPAEIEAHAAVAHGVAQVAVVGVPDERMGEVGWPIVVPPPASPARLAQNVMRWARDTMANYKVPRQVVLVEACPLNARGKVLSASCASATPPGKIMS